MSGLDEFELIDTYLAPLAAGAPGAFGLKDDAALFKLEPGENVVVTTDSVVAGVHFLADDPPGDIARKALRVNLSDLAAMGARPCAYTLAAVLPPDTTPPPGMRPRVSRTMCPIVSLRSLWLSFELMPALFRARPTRNPEEPESAAVSPRRFLSSRKGSLLCSHQNSQR